MNIGINKFVSRQLESTFRGTRLTCEQLNTICLEANSRNYKMKEGYAPFCKIITLDNIFKITCPIVKISDIQTDVKTKYEARREGELPILCRYVVGIEGVIAHHIDVILYTNEHLKSENEECSGHPFDIICVNAEMEVPAPMSPDTMIRNHLGPEFGGSGVKLNLDKYKKSVEFWSNHVLLA